jgi:gamma-tubulin complex component 2
VLLPPPLGDHRTDGRPPTLLTPQEYHLLLTQLETLFLTSPTFTLQKAFFHLHPTIHTLSLLHSLTTTLYDADDNEDVDEAEEEESSEDEDALALGLGGNALKGLINGGAEAGQEGGGGLVKGGEVLELIWQIGRRMSGSVTSLASAEPRSRAADRFRCICSDPTARTIYATLFLHASQPYAQMLVRWVSSGHLSDKHEEFLVKESTSITKKHLDVDFTDEYWERRYTVRQPLSSRKFPRSCWR